MIISFNGCLLLDLFSGIDPGKKSETSKDGINDDIDGNVDDGNGNGNVDDGNGNGNGGGLAAGEIALNTTYTKTIAALDTHRILFTAAGGAHTITLTNLTTDVDLEVYADWVPLDDFFNTDGIYSSWSEGLEDEEVVADFASGGKFAIFVDECNDAKGKYTIRISN